jgi:uncharacterized phage protein (TIGR01671 family)
MDERKGIVIGSDYGLVDWDNWAYQDTTEFIVEQSTGITDKSGKEIYEGDILRLDGWKGTQQVVFIEGAFCLAFKDGSFCGDIHYVQHAGQRADIIGNIHENFDLIVD